MKNILVTGGCGFIGTNFISHQLNNTNNKILNLDKLTYSSNLDSGNNLKGNKHYSFIRTDICDSNAVKKAFDEFLPDIIVNFAAETHVDRSIDSPSTFVKTNVFGTLNLLNISLKYFFENPTFKFLHISTDEVYGSLNSNGKPFIESDPYRPNSPYSASKASSDHLVRAWQKTYGLPAIITNCSNNYGPYQFPEKLIPLMIANCIDEKPLPLYGNGENIRDWLHVDDHCRALTLIIENSESNENYNIGGSCEYKNIEIVNKICELLDKLKPRKNSESYKNLIEFVEDRPGHDFRYSIDSSKIQKKLKWKTLESFDSIGSFS